MAGEAGVSFIERTCLKMPGVESFLVLLLSITRPAFVSEVEGDWPSSSAHHVRMLTLFLSP